MAEEMKEDIAGMKNWQHQHGIDDERRFTELGSNIDEIKGDIKLIKENHLAHIQIAMEQLSTNFTWMKWIGGGFVTAVGLLALKALGL